MALNYHELRERVRHQRTRPVIWPWMAVLGLTVALMTLMFLTFRGCAYSAELTDFNITKAAIGEAIGEGNLGEEAVCRAILNRGTLKGVYGLRAPVVKLATKADWKQAQSALAMARTRDITHGATGWGNASDIKIFKRHAWWKHCVITAHLGNHWFYKEKRG